MFGISNFAIHLMHFSTGTYGYPFSRTLLPCALHGLFTIKYRFHETIAQIPATLFFC